MRVMMLVKTTLENGRGDLPARPMLKAMGVQPVRS